MVHVFSLCLCEDFHFSATVWTSLSATRRQSGSPWCRCIRYTHIQSFIILMMVVLNSWREKCIQNFKTNCICSILWSFGRILVLSLKPSVKKWGESFSDWVSVSARSRWESRNLCRGQHSALLSYANLKAQLQFSEARRKCAELKSYHLSGTFHIHIQTGCTSHVCMWKTNTFLWSSWKIAQGCDNRLKKRKQKCTCVKSASGKLKIIPGFVLIRPLFSSPV